MDGDGDLDILASDRKGKNSRVFWLENPNGTGEWKEHVIGAVGVVDVDGDGQMDIVGTCEHADKELSGVFWLSYSQSPTDKQWTDHDIGGPLGLKYDRIEMIDGDGDLDLMSCEDRDHLGVFWYENASK